jgi:hypothetical protein
MIVSQNFIADLCVEQEPQLSTTFNLTINRMYRGRRVDAISVDPASKEFETKRFKRLDLAGLRIGLVTGYKAVLRVETSGDRILRFELLGLKEEEDGKVKMAVKGIGEVGAGDPLGIIGSFKRANMDINVFRNIIREPGMAFELLIRGAALAPASSEPGGFLPANLPGFFTWVGMEARYNSRDKIVSFRNDGNDFGSGLGGLFSNAIEVELRRSGSSGEGEEKVVAKVEWVKADSEGLKVKLSNKGFVGVGASAKRAIKALDGLKSGSYSMRIGGLADAFDIEGREFGAEFAGGSPGWRSILIDVEYEALLKKTRKVGLFELEFKTKEDARILYKDEDDENKVRSKSVKSYLRGLAGNYDEPFPDDSCEDGWWVCEPAPKIVIMKTEGGLMLGMLSGLRWDANNDVWVAKVDLGLADAERLQTRSTVDQIMLWFL